MNHANKIGNIARNDYYLQNTYKPDMLKVIRELKEYKIKLKLIKLHALLHNEIWLDKEFGINTTDNTVNEIRNIEESIK